MIVSNFIAYMQIKFEVFYVKENNFQMLISAQIKFSMESVRYTDSLNLKVLYLNIIYI
jgi:hypothetical protein